MIISRLTVRHQVKHHAKCMALYSDMLSSIRNQTTEQQLGVVPPRILLPLQRTHTTIGEYIFENLDDQIATWTRWGDSTEGRAFKRVHDTLVEPGMVDDTMFVIRGGPPHVRPGKPGWVIQRKTMYLTFGNLSAVVTLLEREAELCRKVGLRELGECRISRPWRQSDVLVCEYDFCDLQSLQRTWAEWTESAHGKKCALDLQTYLRTGMAVELEQVI